MIQTQHVDVTKAIIGTFYTVYNTLGYGFAEKIYQNAMIVELKTIGLDVVSEQPIYVYYKSQSVGEFYADLIVNDVVIVELKAVKELHHQHEAQILNYLKSTTYEVGLLLNFGPQAEIQRKSYTNSRKGNLSWIKK